MKRKIEETCSDFGDFGGAAAFVAVVEDDNQDPCLVPTTVALNGCAQETRATSVYDDREFDHRALRLRLHLRP